MRTRYLGPGAVAGLVLVAFMMITILLDQMHVTRQTAPPPFIGDLIPNKHEVCTGGPDLEAVRDAEAAFVAHGWPAWPEPSVVDCEKAHGTTGLARWHSCETLRSEDGRVFPPCTKEGTPTDGATYVNINEGVLTIDIYIDKHAKKCVVAHEFGHARGLLATPEEDAETPHVQGGHTESPGHLMAQPCGDGWRWLNRNEEGDWTK